MDLRAQNFGIEIEQTGITRYRAAQALAEYFGTRAEHEGGGYDEYSVCDAQGRNWKIVSDGSIDCQKKEGSRRVSADRAYSVEMVSPICQYKDIEQIQEIVRKLREAGSIINPSCGIHVHISSAPFDARTLRNLVNIVYAKEDMIYRALQVESGRERHYCRKTDPRFVEKLNRTRPTSLEGISQIWYDGNTHRSRSHYDDSRYHCLNLHSTFSKGTVEFRAFNSGDATPSGSGGTLHAGKIKAYIQFCLAITAQALNQKYASPAKSQTTNDKYSFRVWLLRLGMIGDEFKTAREHLLGHLEGCIAWRDPAQALQQKERLRKQRSEQAWAEPEQSAQPAPVSVPEPEESMDEPEEEQGFSMSMSM